jgi:hypothetical protein
MKQFVAALLVLLGGVVWLILNTSTSRAQGMPTPNATVAALQTQAADWEQQLPALQATQQAAKEQAAEAAQKAQEQAGLLSQVQAAVNAGLGQQALELAGQANEQLQPLLAAATINAQASEARQRGLATAEAAYRQALPAMQATARAYPATVQAAVQQPVAALGAKVETLENDNNRLRQERDRTQWGFIILTVLLAAVSIMWVRSIKAKQTTPALPGTKDSPLSDQERLPRDGLQFTNNPDLVAHFNEIHHPDEDLDGNEIE